jgi:hypothetical protein
MIIGIIEVLAQPVDESPITRTEFLYTAKCDCGCEYQTSFAVSNEEVKQVFHALHVDALSRMNHWLATDPHGSQLIPSPILKTL